MAGVNVAGISKVFGDEAKLKSCELHFKDRRNKKGQKLESESSDEFKQLCDRLLLDTRPLTAELSGQAGYHGGMSTVGLFSMRSPTPLHRK